MSTHQQTKDAFCVWTWKTQLTEDYSILTIE